MSNDTDEVFNWTDKDFKKNVNYDEYIYDNRLNMQSEIVICYCEYCGEKFAIVRGRGRPRKYCCEVCKTNARRHQSRMKAHRWYHRHKHELDEKRRWGLGSGTLGQHRHEDFNKEQDAIKKELVRLRISNKKIFK